MKQFSRSDRVRNQMLRDVRELLEPELTGKLDGMVTFTDVELTKDLRYATVFYSFLGSDKGRLKAANYLSKIRARVQGDLGRMLSIKFIPEIKFRYDESIEKGMRIQELLNNISTKPAEDKTDDE